MKRLKTKTAADILKKEQRIAEIMGNIASSSRSTDHESGKLQTLQRIGDRDDRNILKGIERQQILVASDDVCEITIPSASSFVKPCLTMFNNGKPCCASASIHAIYQFSFASAKARTESRTAVPRDRARPFGLFLLKMTLLFFDFNS
jgi:hypothetical protein